MSNRVMSILADFSPRQEVYSIDECFLDMTGFSDLSTIAQAIRTRVRRSTGLPVCAGIARTKTLSKLANHVAKKRPVWNGVCDLTSLTAAEVDATIGALEVGEVWGVGRKISARLNELGINTVRQLRQANPAQIRKSFSVVLERTVAELNDISCIELEEVAPDKQQIMVSRSFGAPAFAIDELENAVSVFVARAAEKLRKQASCASVVMVFIHTSPFKIKEPQYSRSISVPLPRPTDDTLGLTGAVVAGLHAIYLPGFAYAKAGVMLLDLVSLDRVPTDLFEPPMQLGGALMNAMDNINAKFGKGSLTTAAALPSKSTVWQMRQDRKSPCYTTRFEDLIRLRG